MTINKNDRIQSTTDFVENQCRNNQSNQPQLYKMGNSQIIPISQTLQAYEEPCLPVGTTLGSNIRSINIGFPKAGNGDSTQPENVFSPEGIWLPGAINLFKSKHNMIESADQKATEDVKKLMLFLYQNPQIEIYTRNCNDGKRSVLNKDFLSSSKCAYFFEGGAIPGNCGDMEPVFVNKAQFKIALEKAFSESSNEPVGSIINNPLPVEKIEQEAKQKRKNHELHHCIGIVVSDLRMANDGFNPSGAAAWRVLKKCHKEFDCIKAIEKDEKSNDDVIRWVSVNGTNQTMKKSSFLNVVSQYNSGTKSL